MRSCATAPPQPLPPAGSFATPPPTRSPRPPFPILITSCSQRTRPRPRPRSRTHGAAVVGHALGLAPDLISHGGAHSHRLQRLSRGGILTYHVLLRSTAIGDARKKAHLRCTPCPASACTRYSSTTPRRRDRHPNVYSLDAWVSITTRHSTVRWNAVVGLLVFALAV
ncbi:hypothetical protein QYE76_043993 [Lolium multiflorum]|uniref:Uncharacterized protein n=1 Tax=Lolium multiflorum TaxID=4521 RepID=A0AAD8WWC3_LOLMU|nr:hypothetical protein QYE76_043993 [Lolium multiflorum]